MKTKSMAMVAVLALTVLAFSVCIADEAEGAGGPWTVTTDGNMTISPTKVADGSRPTLSLTAKQGWDYPATITVKMGGATLDARTDYTYNTTNGTITLKVIADGNITVIGNATPGTFTVTWIAGGEVIHSARVTVGSSIPWVDVPKNYEGWIGWSSTMPGHNVTISAYGYTKDPWASSYTLSYEWSIVFIACCLLSLVFTAVIAWILTDPKRRDK